MSRGWSYDSAPSGLTDQAPDDLNLQGVSRKQTTLGNNRGLCVTSTTLEARWHSDFGKSFDGKLVQVEVQFGKVESMFKDFCGFTIAWFERRLSLGIEIILCEPSRYFSHRRESTSGMAYFDVARRTLPAIGLNCPIWLVGIRE
jgi:hypothetical protein